MSNMVLPLTSNDSFFAGKQLTPTDNLLVSKKIIGLPFGTVILWVLLPNLSVAFTCKFHADKLSKSKITFVLFENVVHDPHVELDTFFVLYSNFWSAFILFTLEIFVLAVSVVWFSKLLSLVADALTEGDVQSKIFIFLGGIIYEF